MTPKLSNGFNFNLIYQRALKENLKIRGQLSFSGFQKKFKMSGGGRLATSRREGELNVQELSVGVLSLKRIHSKPIIHLGVGINGIREIGDPDIKTITKSFNFQTGASSTTERTIKQSELIKRYGLGLILRGEIVIPVASSLNFLSGISLNQRLTNFAKEEFSASNVLLTRVNIELGLIKKI